jgi:hypothetical protein
VRWRPSTADSRAGIQRFSVIPVTADKLTLVGDISPPTSKMSAVTVTSDIFPAT